jgi:HAMP domain-containing protein
MKEKEKNLKAPVHGIETKWTQSVGTRIFVWIVFLFLVALILFVALDIHHELRAAKELGASEEKLSALWLNTIGLHLVHGAVTILLFGIGIYLVVHRLVTRRIEAIISAIKRFRLGIWKARIPESHRDEIEWLADAFRQLGPYLEKQILTFVEVDRKGFAVRMGKMYEARLTPKAKEIFNVASSMVEEEKNYCAWFQVKQGAVEILNELEFLGRPEHLEILNVIHFKESFESIVGETPAEKQVSLIDGGSRK